MKEILLPIVLCFLILGCVLTHSSLQDKTTEKLEKYSEEVIAKCTCAERYLPPITALLRETEARNTILEENLVIERGITAGLQAAEVSLESAIEERGIRLKEVESELVRLSQEKLLAVDYEKIIDNLNATTNLLAAEKEDISAKLQEKQEEVNQLLVENAKILATDKILTEEMNVIQNQLYWKKLLVFCLEIMAIAESLLCIYLGYCSFFTRNHICKPVLEFEIHDNAETGINDPKLTSTPTSTPTSKRRRAFKVM